MPESPISASPYEVLGVSPSATQEELRTAYRRRLREAHPDTGGSSARFVAVQRAWERVGTDDDRARYDRGRSSTTESGRLNAEPGFTWAPRPKGQQEDTRPRARSYGHPGGWRRERYLARIREWVGLGEPIPDPYAPSLVRSAPKDIRHILADALAEESTARTLSALGIGFTVWHDVSTGNPEQKLDHVVLGPSGLFALLSEDYGEPVRLRRGDFDGEPLGERRPFHELGQRAKVISRAARVKFSALAIVLPDDQLDEPIAVVGTIRGATAVAVQQSALSALMRDGAPGSRLIGGNELFDARTRIQDTVRFV